jgi:hypothetical protein
MTHVTQISLEVVFFLFFASTVSFQLKTLYMEKVRHLRHCVICICFTSTYGMTHTMTHDAPLKKAGMNRPLMI